MRFEVEHRFEGSPVDVAQILADPEFYRELDLPDVGRPEVEESRADGSRLTIRLRYEFVGSLDPMARRLLGRNRLAWVQELVVDRSDGSGDLSFHAQADPRRLHGTAHFILKAQDHRCARHLTGELVVAVPVIGPAAERKIVPGVIRRLGIEADAVNDVLARETN